MFWEPGWKKTPPPEFREKVSRVLEQSPRGWVVDGNYSRFGHIVQRESTDIICASTLFDRSLNITVILMC
jgi:hypothetical protein